MVSQHVWLIHALYILMGAISPKIETIRRTRKCSPRASLQETAYFFSVSSPRERAAHALLRPGGSHLTVKLARKQNLVLRAESQLPICMYHAENTMGYV